MFKNNRSSLVCTIALGLALVTGASIPAVADSSTGNEGYASNEKDSLYGDAPSGLNPLDLMHRSQQLNGRSAAEFEEESQVQINDSVSDFKRLQQKRILEQQQQSRDTSVELESVEIVK